MEKEIFGLEITEEGIYWLEKFRALAVIVLAATIIFYGLYSYTTLSMLLKNDYGALPGKYRLMNTLFMVNLIVGFILQTLQVVFYYRFAATSNLAVETNNSVLLNHSFKWLYRQAVVFIILFAISLTYFTYSYFTRPT